MGTYDPPTVAGTGMLPGIIALGNELAKRFGVPSPKQVGGYNPRCVWDHRVAVGRSKCDFGHTISFHAESRAFDAMSSDRFVHESICAWLIQNSQAWGVQEIVTGWSPINGEPGRWTTLTGWDDYFGPKNHRDHVHVSITLEAAHRNRPAVEEEDDMAKYTFYTPVDHFDILAVGPGVPFHVKAPSSAQELVDKKLVTVLSDGRFVDVPAGTPYASVATELSVATWTDMSGFAPGSPK